MPRNNRGVEEGEAVPDLVVPGQRQDQEEDALLILLRRPEKVPGRSAEVYTGGQHLIETKTQMYLKGRWPKKKGKMWEF